MAFSSAWWWWYTRYLLPPPSNCSIHINFQLDGIRRRCATNKINKLSLSSMRDLSSKATVVNFRLYFLCGVVIKWRGVCHECDHQRWKQPGVIAYWCWSIWTRTITSNELINCEVCAKFTYIRWPCNQHRIEFLRLGNIESGLLCGDINCTFVRFHSSILCTCTWWLSYNIICDRSVRDSICN